MFLKFDLPIMINLVATGKEEIESPSINFNYQKNNCFIVLQSRKDIVDEEENKKTIYRRDFYSMSITVEDDERGMVENFVKKRSMAKILKLINSIGNRCLSVFRNYGNLSKIKEFYLQLDTQDMEQYKSFFIMLAVEISENNLEYEKILKYWDFEIDFAKEFISSASRSTYFNIYSEEYLKYDNWLEIKKGLENNLEITEERYFFVNSLEHIQNHNIRLAVIETVISLEITVNKYLKNYLKTKNIPSDRIKHLINPHLGIYPMVSVLLDLTVEEELMSNIKIDEVLKLITLRNKIVHENKQISKEPSEQDKIIYQMSLAHVLCQILIGFCNKRIEIKALLKNTQKQYGIKDIEIRFMYDEPVIVLIVNLKEHDSKIIDKINFSIRNSLKGFRRYEKLYNEKDHLYINYRLNKKVLAKFSKGSLVFSDQ
jgi:hypothetical protein